MLFHSELFTRSKCLRDEKKNILQYIDLIIRFSEKSRKEGLLSLEDDINSITYPLLREGLLMVVDGTDPEVVTDYLSIKMFSSDIKGSEMLKALICSDGILMIQQGDNPRIILLKLLAYLGDDRDLYQDNDLNKDYSSTPSYDAPSIEEATDNAVENPSLSTNNPLSTEAIIESVNKSKHLSKEQIDFTKRYFTSDDFFKKLGSDYIAVLLMYMDEETHLSVLKELPFDTQVEVIRNIVKRIKNNDTGEDAIDYFINEGRKIFDALVDIRNNNYMPSGNIKLIAKHLQKCSRSAEEKILETIHEDAPELVDEIRKQIFSFDDINLLGDRDVQKLLREIDTTELAKALKGCSKETQEKIFRNMSKRAKEVLKEDMDFMGLVRLSDVEEAKKKITSIIWRLAESGDILIDLSGRDELIY